MKDKLMNFGYKFWNWDAPNLAVVYLFVMSVLSIGLGLFGLLDIFIQGFSLPNAVFILLGISFVLPWIVNKVVPSYFMYVYGYLDSKVTSTSDSICGLIAIFWITFAEVVVMTLIFLISWVFGIIVLLGIAAFFGIWYIAYQHKRKVQKEK